VSLSKPMQMFAVRLTDEERAQLERVARERKVTLSYAIRQGLKLYLEDWSDRGEVGREVVR
jgi:predicted transcriptional regulator